MNIKLPEDEKRGNTGNTKYDLFQEGKEGEDPIGVAIHIRCPPQLPNLELTQGRRKGQLPLPQSKYGGEAEVGERTLVSRVRIGGRQGAAVALANIQGKI